MKSSRQRTPSVLQMEAVECGAASLGMVLRYFGRRVPLDVLRVDCGISRDGSKAANILRAARKYGLVAKGFRQTTDELRSVLLPAIIFWEARHFLVLEGFGPKGAFLNDPAMGPRRISMDEFARGYSGIVLTFERGPEFQPGGRSESVWPGLRERLVGVKSGLGFMAVTTLFLVLPGIVVPGLSKVFVDDVLVGGMTGWVRPLIMGLASAAILQGVLTYLQGRCLQRTEAKLAIVNASRFFRHVLALPVTFFQQRFPGEIGSRVELNDQLASLLSGQLASNAVGLFLIVFFGAMMLLYDPILTAVAVATAVGNLLVLKLISGKLRDMNLRLMQDEGRLVGASMAGLQLIETLKSGGSEGYFFSRWAGYQTQTLNSRQSLGQSSLLLSSIPTILGAMSSAAVLGIGGYQVMRGHLSLGSLIAFQSLMGSFLGPVSGLVGLGGSLQAVAGTIKRLDDVLDCPTDERPPMSASEQALEGVPAKLSGRLELRGLTFGYSPLEAPLIDDFNLVIRPGERVALVGPTGSGKSTLSRLISGTYRQWKGQILFDGIERDRLPGPILTTSFGVVDQDIFLFEGTVRENLTLWDHTVPDEQLLQACKDACIHEVIAARAGGYDSKVEEGGRNFSGGQRQRLEIARALVNRPTLMLLDEATSALDASTERQIDENLRRRGCSCIIVAHRLSTIRDCDRIIVMREGKAVQSGTHDQLLQEAGIYVNLVTV
jgi:NHLM bacteriocin system ABC transporter peptidase/ATP-binding protein